MKSYIVSLVMAKKLDDKGNISLQNVVGVTKQSTPEEAYEKVKTRGKLQFPDHNIVVKVIVEMQEAMAEDIN